MPDQFDPPAAPALAIPELARPELTVPVPAAFTASEFVPAEC
jgi:hypothetical protein